MSDAHIYTWACLLAREIGGEAWQDDAGVHIRPASLKWEQVVGDRQVLDLLATPDSMSAWRTRIQYVEKMTAKAILAGPIGFSCTLVEPVGREKIEILRLAFGLSLSNGLSCRQRYTAYYIFEKDLVFFTKGTDRLFECDTTLASIEKFDKNLDGAIQKLLCFIPFIEDEYKNSPVVRKQLSKLREAYSAELRDLERLYSPGHGQNIAILGNPPEGVRGDDTIEVEYGNRMEDIIEKYRLSLLFEPLSIGLIHCFARLAAVDGETEISLPFVDRPLKCMPSPATAG